MYYKLPTIIIIMKKLETQIFIYIYFKLPIIVIIKNRLKYLQYWT
jgi:hypothetical protein